MSLIRSHALATLLLLIPLACAQPSVLDDDAGSGQDAGDDPGAALRLGPGRYTGRLVPQLNDAVDAYAVALTRGEGIHVTVASDLLPAVTAYLVSPDGIEIGREPTGSTTLRHLAAADQDGAWILVVESVARIVPALRYHLTIEVAPEPPQDDAGDGRDAGNSAASALSLGPGTERAAFLGADSRDVFALDAASEVRVVSTPPVDLASTRDGDTLVVSALKREMFGAPTRGTYYVLTPDPTPREAPPHDRADAAIPLPMGHAWVGSNLGATIQAGETTTCTPGLGWLEQTYGKTLWFSYNAEVDGLVEIDLDGSDVYLIAAAYEGASMDDLEPLDCDAIWEGNTTLRFPVQAGRAYRIQLGGIEGLSGPISLTARSPRADLGVAFASTAARDPLDLTPPVRVVVTNDGPHAADARVRLQRITSTESDCEGDGALVAQVFTSVATGMIPPGEAREVVFEWNGPVSVGQVLRASLAGHPQFFDPAPSNDVACAIVDPVA